MFYSKYIILSIFLIQCTFANYCEACCDSKPSGGDRDPQIDYVQLAVQNAEAFCEMKHCNAPITGWSIHGLWPSQKGVMGPNSCNSTASFDPDLMNGILSQMDKEWPTLFGGDSTGFWCHEWCKHGTCAQAASSIPKVVSMLSYFQTGLSLFQNVDMNTALQNKGIVSSTNTTYKLSDFMNVFTPKPAFECTNFKDGQLLFGARFCFTPDLEPADCNMDWFASIQSCDENTPIYYI